MGSTTPDPPCADAERGRMEGRRIGQQQQQQQQEHQEEKMARIYLSKKAWTFGRLCG